MPDLREYEVTARFTMADEKAARMVAEVIGKSLIAMGAATPVPDGRAAVSSVRLVRILDEQKVTDG